MADSVDFTKITLGGICIGHLLRYSIIRKTKQRRQKEMKGYNTEIGYMGLVNGEYLLFASESDYREWLEDEREVF